MKTPLLPALGLLVPLFLAPVAICDDGGAANPGRELMRSQYSNIENSARLVIRDQKAWTEWWNTANTDLIEQDGKFVPPKPPQVDFKKETVILAAMGRQGSGGFDITIRRIGKDGDKLIVTVATRSPPPDSVAATVITSPVVAVAVPKHDGTVEFADN